jgi:hypothetical protein
MDESVRSDLTARRVLTVALLTFRTVDGNGFSFCGRTAGLVLARLSIDVPHLHAQRPVLPGYI